MTTDLPWIWLIAACAAAVSAWTGILTPFPPPYRALAEEVPSWFAAALIWPHSWLAPLAPPAPPRIDWASWSPCSGPGGEKLLHQVLIQPGLGQLAQVPLERFHGLQVVAHLLLHAQRLTAAGCCLVGVVLVVLPAGGRRGGGEVPERAEEGGAAAPRVVTPALLRGSRDTLPVGDSLRDLGDDGLRHFRGLVGGVLHPVDETLQHLGGELAPDAFGEGRVVGVEHFLRRGGHRGARAAGADR